MMKNRLSIPNRLILPGILPPQGDLITMTLCEDIREKIKFTQEEFTEIGLKVEESRYIWENEKNIDVEFTDKEVDIIRTALDEKDKKAEVTPQLLDLYRKFS